MTWAKVPSSFISIVLSSTLGSFTYGFNSSIMGTVLGLASFYTYFNLDLKGDRASYANSIIGGWFSDKSLPSSLMYLTRASQQPTVCTQLAVS